MLKLSKKTQNFCISANSYFKTYLVPSKPSLDTAVWIWPYDLPKLLINLN